MSNSNDNNSNVGGYALSAFSVQHGWGKQTREPMWRDIGHNVLESTKPGAKHYIKRDGRKYISVKSNVVKSLLSGKEVQQAAE